MSRAGRRLGLQTGRGICLLLRMITYERSWTGEYVLEVLVKEQQDDASYYFRIVVEYLPL